jgi:peptidoglycan/LPS O-acetylase OafA/YrhL
VRRDERGVDRAKTEPLNSGLVISKLPGLQVGRAVAALGVAYLHSAHVIFAFPPDAVHPIPIVWSYGAAGVDLFFGISGFVICLLVTKPGFDPISFLIRRVFRIWPLWIMTSLVYLYMTRYTGLAPWQTKGYFLYSLTLLPTHDLPFYDLGWTLQHEVAFYALVSLVAPWFGLRGLAGILAVFSAASHLGALPFYLHKYAAYYDMFLAGIFAFMAMRHSSRIGFWIPIAVCVFMFWLEAELGDQTRILRAIGIFAAIIGFLNLPSSDRLTSRMGQLLGDASYSIYLIHPLVFLVFYIHLNDPLPPGWIAEPLRFLAILLACAVSVCSWLCFERPIIAIGVHLTKLRSVKIDQSSASNR